MPEREFDVIIIGGGPGGYLAAERLGAKGLNVLLLERDHLGGVCLNRGCIPTKTLLHSAKLYHSIAEGERYGVSAPEIRFDLSKAMAWKQKVIETLRRGVSSQMKRHRVTVLQAVGTIKDRNTVLADGEEYSGKFLVIATGSSPLSLPIKGADSPRVLTSAQALELESLPKRLVVIGGGVIGCEFASYFSMVGVEVTVVELLAEIIPNLDSDIGALLRKAMPKVTFHLGSRVEEISDGSAASKAVKVIFSNSDGRQILDTDAVLMAVGRTPNTGDLGLDGIGLDYSKSGIAVNEAMQTNLPGVFAVGDVNGRSMLAHSAYRMAEVAAKTICGERDHMRYHAVPWVVYTHPQVSRVAMTEGQAREQGRSIEVRSLPLRINGRFLAEHGNDPGVCKVIVDEKTGTLLGVQIVDSPASEIIHGAGVMIEAELRVKDIREIVFPHPTVSEIVRDTIWTLE